MKKQRVSFSFNFPKPVLLLICEFAVIEPTRKYNPRNGYLPRSITSFAGVCKAWRAVYNCNTMKFLRECNRLFKLIEIYKLTRKEIRHYCSMEKLIDGHDFTYPNDVLTLHCMTNLPRRIYINAILFLTSPLFYNCNVTILAKCPPEFTFLPQDRRILFANRPRSDDHYIYTDRFSPSFHLDFRNLQGFIRECSEALGCYLNYERCCPTSHDLRDLICGG